MKITKRIVFTSSFVLISGSLLLGTAFYQSFIFKPSLTCEELSLKVNEEEDTLTYKLQYSISKNNRVTLRLKNEFYHQEIFINHSETEQGFAVGSFYKLTKNTIYTISLLESGIAVYSEEVKITYN